MFINDQCDNWKLTYELDTAELTAEELVEAAGIIHPVCDAVGILGQIRKQSVRKKILQLYKEIMSATKMQFQAALMFVNDQEVMNTELSGEFSHDAIFGENLKDKLATLLDSEEDKEAFDEAFPSEDDFNGGGDLGLDDDEAN